MESADSKVVSEKGLPDEAYKSFNHIEEISPNQRYIRFGELISQTENIKASYKAFDTKNGIEVCWHTINLSGLNDLEQEEVARSANYLKGIQDKYVAQYLAIWVEEEPRRLIIITTLLESLRV